MAFTSSTSGDRHADGRRPGRLLARVGIAAALLGLAQLLPVPVPAHAVPEKSIHVCKKAVAGSGLSGSFTFTVNPPNVTVQVPVGGCTQVKVNAVNLQGIVITEVVTNGAAVTAISVPWGTTLSSDVANRTVTVADDTYVNYTNPSEVVSGEPGTVTFTNKKVTAPCVKAPLGMVDWYPFDEVVGTTTALNLVPPSPYADVFNGAAFATGKVANALHFDGVDDYARSTTPDHNVGLGDFSIDFWIKTSPMLGAQTVIDKRTGSVWNNLRGYSVYLQNGKVFLQMADGTGAGYTNYPSTASVDDGEWHLVVITVRRSNTAGIKFYKDNVLVTYANPTLRPGSLSNDGRLFFGRNALSNASTFRGALDEVEIFNVELPSTTVADLWSAGSSGKCKKSEMPS